MIHCSCVNYGPVPLCPTCSVQPFPSHAKLQVQLPVPCPLQRNEHMLAASMLLKWLICDKIVSRPLSRVCDLVGDVTSSAQAVGGTISSTERSLGSAGFLLMMGEAYSPSTDLQLRWQGLRLQVSGSRTIRSAQCFRSP